MSETFRADAQREKELLEWTIVELCKLKGVQILGAHDAPHILSLSIPGVPVQNTINLLQERGICVSAGSACAKGHRSHVLSAMGLPPETVDGAFRVSLSRETTQAEMEALVEGVKGVLAWKNR